MTDEEIKLLNHWQSKLKEMYQTHEDMGRFTLYLKAPMRIPRYGHGFSRREKKKWVIPYLTLESNVLYVGSKRRSCNCHSHYIYHIPNELYLNIKRIEYTPFNDKFAEFKEFRLKFDTKFITEDKIRGLWRETSNEHGHTYRKSDFRLMGLRGRQVMADFLMRFRHIGIPTEHYDHDGCSPHSYPTHLHAYYHSSHHKGKDIRINHFLPNGHITYSSEHHNCVNGSYYLVANKRELLHLEDD